MYIRLYCGKESRGQLWYISMTGRAMSGFLLEEAMRYMDKSLLYKAIRLKHMDRRDSGLRP